jgi:undecaprenyl diphosphate synthase
MRPSIEAAIHAKRRIDNKERVGNGLPEHVVIVTDGNRRWANENHTSVANGYQEGAKRIGEVAEAAREIGIKNLTFWVLSPDNISGREPEELALWYRALRRHVLYSALPELVQKNARVKAIGRLDDERIPVDIVDNFVRLEEKSRENSGITISFAFNYSGEAELEDAFASMQQSGEAELSLGTFRNHLYTTKAGLPDPEWVIRPGGENRTSGFMPIQIMKAELDLVDVKWPGFTADEFRKSIERFDSRRRTFGGNLET